VRSDKIYANWAEKQAAYRARRKVKDEQTRALTEASRLIVAVARVKGWCNDCMPDAKVLECVAGDLMQDLSPEQKAQVFARAK
jgi:hypothetical protein